MRPRFTWAMLGALVFAGGACAPASPPPPPPASPRDRLPAVEAKLDALIPRLMAAGDVPGLTIALVRDDQLVWQHSYGVADAGTRRPVTPTTMFQAASLTKPVFAYAVMKLVSAGTLDLDRPLTEYLPGSYDVGADPRLALITARHVLSHRTGFPNWRNGALAIQLTPGSQFSYSGEGFVYLAKVVAHITGEPFEAFLQHTVFDPLGMTHSRVGPGDPMTIATAHDTWGDAAPPRRPHNADRDAAAGLYTTAEDYARFVIAVLDGTGLSPALRPQISTPQAHVIAGGPDSIGRPDPRAMPDLAWGLGWGLAATARGPALWHWGDNGDSKAFVVALEQPRAAVVVFANSANGLSIMPAIIDAAVGVPQPGLGWLSYESYDSPRAALARAIHSRGAEAVLRDYRAGRSPRVPEEPLNTLGYQLARARRFADAIAVLAQNVADHPDSANAHDSLGESYDLAGDRNHAIESYERSVALDPGNRHAIEALARLQRAATP